MCLRFKKKSVLKLLERTVYTGQFAIASLDILRIDTAEDVTFISCGGQCI